MRPRPVLPALVLVAAAMAAGCGDDGEAVDETPHDAGADIAEVGPADEGIDGVIAYRISSAAHITGPVDYPVDPPPGGPHHPTWANCGFHDDPIPQAHLVHTLEHGAVWLAYDPDLSEDDVEVLRSLTAGAKVVAAPHPDLADDEAVVATAWTRQLRLEVVDDPRLERFVAQYQDGPEAPEAGVTCTGSPIP